MSEISKKIQKLASAIYLVTDFFRDDEPLKWRLRSLALDLVSERIKDKISTLREAASLFSMAHTGALISSANHEIIHREFAKFEKEAESPLNQIFFTQSAEFERIEEPIYKPESIKDKIEERFVLNKSRHALKEFGAVSIKKNSRQGAIIGLLKRKKEIMIKDISAIIDGCSEKTIQRELLAMVASGVLRKIGEKRWSRYTLAHP